MNIMKRTTKHTSSIPVVRSPEFIDVGPKPIDTELKIMENLGQRLRNRLHLPVDESDHRTNRRAGRVAVVALSMGALASIGAVVGTSKLMEALAERAEKVDDALECVKIYPENIGRNSSDPLGQIAQTYAHDYLNEPSAYESALNSLEDNLDDNNVAFIRVCENDASFPGAQEIVDQG